MRTYNSFKEIKFELTRINLERKIALEQIKQSGNIVQESLTPHSWIVPTIDVIKRFGILFLLKKIFKR